MHHSSHYCPNMSGQVKVWRGEKVLVGEELVSATVVVERNTIKKVLPGVVHVEGIFYLFIAAFKHFFWIQVMF